MSDDATLSDLALTDASDNAIAALIPSFASDTTSYKRNRGQLRLTNHGGRPPRTTATPTIKYLDDSDATLPDDDTSTPDVFDFDLERGGKRRQGEGDRRGRHNHQDLHYNGQGARKPTFWSATLGNLLTRSSCIDATPTADVAIQFTTGSETDGYRISQVRLDIYAELWNHSESVDLLGQLRPAGLQPQDPDQSRHHTNHENRA